MLQPVARFALALLILSGCSGAGEQQALPTAIAELRGIERIVVATGTVEPEGEVEVRPRIAGIVEKILVEPGDQVGEGQVLVEIERELIEAQVAEARARVQAAEVQLRYAGIEVERAAKLQRQGAFSDSAHDEARSFHETAIAMLAQSRAGLETLAVQLRHASVRAPSAGRVLDVPIEIGAAVSPVTSVTGGTVLLSLAATDRLHLEGSVDENEIAKVALEQPARIRTEAYGDRVFEGRVRKIAPVGKRIQNVTYFEVEIEITDEERHLLKPRMSGDANIVTETISEALVVPETALRYAGDQIYVDVVPAEPSPEAAEQRGERKDVEIGVVDGDLVQILSGLEAGERVSLQ
jgi:HlyD family secretion protein